MTGEMKYVLRCINESMRLYPHPPVLIRRATEPDVLPGGCVRLYFSFPFSAPSDVMSV